MIKSDFEEFNRRALDPLRSVVIEASAGSGKTWLLVSRIVRLLLAGIKPGQILAITFTRKTAQEMAARLRAWLLELALAPDDATVRKFLRDRAVPEMDIHALLPKARRLYEESLTAQPPLTIMTFHSWFLQLLKRAPIDAGALGEVNLIEHTAPLIDEAWERFATEMQRTPQSPAALGLEKLFQDFGLENTRRLLLAFLRHRAEWWAYTRHANNREAAAAHALAHLRSEMSFDPDEDICSALFAGGNLTAQLQEFAALLARNTATDQRGADKIAQALESEAPRACFESVREVVLRTDGAYRARKASGAQAGRLGSADEQRLLELHASLSERLTSAHRDLVEQEAYRLNQAALPAGIALLDAYRRAKEERQVIDFSDIECRALELLSSSEHASFLHHKLDARYRHILLDEFQDVNPLQWLTLDAWFTAAQEADALPTVFMVGDPKQSIYRFRGAEARLFVQARCHFAERFEADSDLQRDISRRCPPPVLKLVNAVFLGHEEGFNVHAAHYAAKRGRIEVLPLVETVLPAKSAIAAQWELRNPLIVPFATLEDRRREEEARTIAERIESIVDHWMIASDPKGENSRGADYKDVMLLIRQRTHLATYERALRQAGIPFVTSGRGGLLGTLEAQDMMALLQFLVSPFSDLALAQTLRAPIFSCSDDDLMTLARAPAETWWSSLQRLAQHAPHELSPSLARAARLLALWLERADTLPVHDQLDRIYYESDLLRRYRHAVPPAMQRAVTANLQSFIQRALDTDAGRYPSLPRFIHELIDLGKAPKEEAPDEGIEGDPGNAVRILTVHGAKGLEAPIVFLIDCAAGPKVERGYDVMIDWPPGAAAPRHFSLWTRKAERSRRQEELAAAEQALAVREDTNLLYVAMTRAQQALIISGVQGNGTAESWYGRIHAAAATLPDAAQAGPVIVFGEDLTGCAGSAMSKDDHVASLPHALDAATEPGPLNALLPTGVRRTSLTSRGERYGTHLHRLLELLTGRGPSTRIRAHIQQQLSLSERDFAPLWEQAQRVLTAPKLARFFDPAQYRRAANEVAYVTASGEIFRIDRLVEFADEMWLLDYKSGKPEAMHAVQLQQYHAQLGAYLSAVRDAFPLRRVRAALVFTDATSLEVDH